MPSPRASAWLLATSDTADVSTDRFAPLVEGEADPVPHSWEGATGYLEAVSWRRQRELDNGSAVVWMSPLAHLVDTEEMTPMQLLALVVDCANGAGATIDPAAFVFMNTDTAMHLHRVPVGNDFALRARGSIGPDERAHPGVGSPARARTRVEAGHRRRQRRALRTAPGRGAGPCSASPTEGSAPGTRQGSGPARTPSSTGWRPTVPATSYPTGPQGARRPFKHIRSRNSMSNNGSHIAAPALTVAYHSGYGHTAVSAEAVAAGARGRGAHVTLIAVDEMADRDWDVLDAADAIVFGCATYMGNVSAGFQAFAEQTGGRCMNGTWRDKVLAGFTNSGDKMHTLTSLAVFAAQHHMHWVSLGLGAGWNSSAGSEADLNRLGLAGRGRSDRCGRRPESGASLGCPDVPPPSGMGNVSRW